LRFGIEKHFMGCSVTQRFSWTMIEPVHDEVNLIVGDCIEAEALGDVSPLVFSFNPLSHDAYG